MFTCNRCFEFAEEAEFFLFLFYFENGLCFDRFVFDNRCVLYFVLDRFVMSNWCRRFFFDVFVFFVAAGVFAFDVGGFFFAGAFAFVTLPKMNSTTRRALHARFLLKLSKTYLLSCNP